MKKTILLEDVNLADIQITNEGKNIYVVFLDMYEGKLIASITCEDVLHFVYSNTFCKNDGFACYVGEVTVQTLNLQADISRNLNSMKYRFIDVNGNILFSEEDLHLVDIEGGEVSIVILCKAFPYLQRLDSVE